MKHAASQKRKLFVKPLAFVDGAYPHDLINIVEYKDVKSFCQHVRDQKRNLSKMSIKLLPTIKLLPGEVTKKAPAQKDLS